MRGMNRSACLLFGAIGLAGCAQLGVIGDGTSVSVGRTNGGVILDPARVPDDGDGFWAPPIWRARGARFGTDELVDLIASVGRRVAQAAPGPRLGVGDLSGLKGGDSAHHRSHQSGRDVDLVMFYTDLAGKPIESDAMYVLGDDGRGVTHPVKLDVARQWVLVKALITAPEAQVQRLFIYEPLALLLLDHARAIGEPEALLDRARIVLRQPGDSARHDDHMHVRIFCPASDDAYGCINAGDIEEFDKEPPRLASIPVAQRQALLAPMPAMLALVGWAAFR